MDTGFLNIGVLSAAHLGKNEKKMIEKGVNGEPVYNKKYINSKI